MKKKMIAAGAASLALAAMPVVGVFATTTSVTDYVQLTVTGSCTMSATPLSDGGNGSEEPNALQDYINLGSVAAGGETVTGEGAGVSGTSMTIACNHPSGITLTAEATSLTDGNTSKRPIPFGPYAATTGSVWSAKMTKSGTTSENATISANWANWESPSTDANTIVSLNSDAAVSDLVVTPHYRAKVASDQPAGTYTGNITYTFTVLP